MKKNIISRLLLLLIVLIASSCDKYLSLEPQDGVVKQDFWKTKEQLQAAVFGCYRSLLGSPPGVSDKSLAEYLFLWGELRADMLQAGTNATADDLNVINVNIQSSNSITNWSAVYRTINYCNTVIDLAPGVRALDKTLTQDALNAYMGEALALRGLMYFYLARSFGDVPLKLKSTASDEDNLQLPKSSQREVFDQIVKDLKLAGQYVVNSYGNRDFDKGRITKYAVDAMLADVYLWLDQYDNAVASCDKIIKSNQFSLIPGDSNWFSTLYYQGNSNESIFEFQFDQNALNPFYNMFSGGKRLKGALRVSEEIYTVDPINIENKDLRGDRAAENFADASIWKYQGINSTTTRASSASYAHWIVYRYADVLLMKAEALNQLIEGQEALDIIKTIRTRGKALATTEMVVLPDDKNGITDYILNERAREFAFEGKRWYDLLRNARRNDYERNDLLLNVVSTTALPENQQSAIAKYQDHRSHYFPFYLYELQTNKNLIQNPFYQ